jgi:hypothetical protein
MYVRSWERHSRAVRWEEDDSEALSDELTFKNRIETPSFLLYTRWVSCVFHFAGDPDDSRAGQLTFCIQRNHD